MKPLHRHLVTIHDQKGHLVTDAFPHTGEHVCKCLEFVSMRSLISGDIICDNINRWSPGFKMPQCGSKFPKQMIFRQGVYHVETLVAK